MSAADVLTGLLFFAAFNEAAIELILGRWHKDEIDRFLPLVSIVLGVAECMLFSINGLALLGIPGPALAGQVITGVVVGGGAGVVHKFFGKPSRDRNSGNIV